MAAPIAAKIMDRSEMTLTADIDLRTAMSKLLQAKLTGAPVIDSEGRLCGILTEKDCLKALVRQAVDGAPSGRVRDYMTTAVESVTESTRLLDIAQLFLRHSFRKLPVVNERGIVVGQVSRRDVLRAIESAKDNPFLYGREEPRPEETGGVDSAMRRARGK